MTLLTAAAHNFSGLFALRWFLGMSESAFFPLVIYYQVRKNEKLSVVDLEQWETDQSTRQPFTDEVNLLGDSQFSTQDPVSQALSLVFLPSALSKSRAARCPLGSTSSLWKVSRIEAVAMTQAD